MCCSFGILRFVLCSLFGFIGKNNAIVVGSAMFDGRLHSGPHRVRGRVREFSLHEPSMLVTLGPTYSAGSLGHGDTTHEYGVD